MKTTRVPKIAVLMLITLLLAFASCNKVKDEIRERHIALIVDRSDPQKDSLHFQDVSVWLSAQDVPYHLITFRVRRVTNIKHDTIRNSSIKGWTPLQQSMYPQYKRLHEQKAFLDSCKQMLTFHDIPGTNGSDIFVPVLEELIDLTHYSQTSEKICIIHSDLLETEAWQSYGVTGVKTLSNPTHLVEALNTRFTIPDLQGVTIYVWHHPLVNKEDIHRFNTLVDIYTKLFETKHHAIVKVVSNFQ